MKTRLFRLVVPYLLLAMGLYLSFGLLNADWNISRVQYLCVEDLVPPVEAFVLIVVSSYLIHLEGRVCIRSCDGERIGMKRFAYRLALLLLTFGTMALVFGFESLVVVTFLHPTPGPVSYVFECFTPNTLLPLSGIFLFLGFFLGWAQNAPVLLRFREFFWVVGHMRSWGFLFLGVVLVRMSFLSTVHQRLGHFLAGPQLYSRDAYYLGVVSLVASFLFIYNSVDLFKDQSIVNRKP